MKQFIGTGVALVTPFLQDFSIDVDSLSRIVDHCIDGGVDYLVVLGTTAESVTLSSSEKDTVCNTIVAANKGRLPLVLGIGGNNTAAIVEELGHRDSSAFSAILSVSPYYNKPTQEGIYQHFKAISNASPLPIILYNVPGRTASNMLPATTLRLAGDFENIVAIKEASGDMSQVRQIIKDKPKDFLVISGDDSIALSTVLSGGAGVISVLGQGLPNEFSSMIRSALEGDVERANALHKTLEEGMELIFKEGNPAGIKAIFEHLVLCQATVRLPLVEASTDLKKTLGNFMLSFVKVQS